MRRRRMQSLGMHGALLSFCQNVKRTPLKIHSSHQNTSWWPKQPFFGNLQNAPCCHIYSYCFITEENTSEWNHQESEPGNVGRILTLSDLTSPGTNQEWMTLKLYFKNAKQAFHLPNSWLRRMKQYCLPHETQVFDLPNNIVWRVKQYCFAV